MALDASRDYPLGSRRPELLRTPSGRPFGALSLDAEIDAADLRATPETLRLQAEVARDAGRPQLADNLVRAAELATVPQETILDVYTALRPRRSTAVELESWAARLDDLGAPANAAFVRAAAAVYAERGLLAL